MPFTPDDQLELLFDPKIIPQRIKDQVPAGYHLRPLASTDYDRGHLEVLKMLNAVPERGRGRDAYLEQFAFQRSCPSTYFIIVMVHKESDTVAGTGTIVVERKYRGMARVAHIEDVAVTKALQGGRLGWLIVQTLIALSDANGCYKMTGRGDPRVIPYYDKLKDSVFDNREMNRWVTLDLMARL